MDEDQIRAKMAERLQKSQMGGVPQPQITPAMVRDAKTLTCTCGSSVFQTGVVFKKISALLSPSGQEIDIPIQVFFCRECGLVPAQTDPDNVLPEAIKSK